ncbi:hypothetical protein LTR43_012213 [Exophiala xenobiotica]|nr:hypothetical protein LTR14_012100 [Exophiala xenobiotica]KAK5434631.1 hypothetical protein LTR55_012407 [Exophiala xenobiotica]
MLFWMAMMCDTFLAVLYKRPCFVSDEDILIPDGGPPLNGGKTADAGEPTVIEDDVDSSPWGTLVLKQADLNLRTRPSMSPMVDDEAHSLRADSAMAKVLLYRKV